MQTNHLTQSEINARLAHRLVSQKPRSANAIIRESGRRMALMGRATLCSGFFRRVTITASI